jgi:hypothetical protein
MLDAGQMAPCLLSGQFHREFPPEQRGPEPVEGNDREDRQDNGESTGNEGRDCLWS